MSRYLLQTSASRFMLIALLAISLLIAACGGGSNQSSNQGANQPSQNQTGSDTPAPSEENPLKGKTITWVVPFSPGGGYDQYARLIAPYLEKYTGATVVVQNVTGGGGMVGTNRVFASQDKDLTIGIIGGSNLIFSQAANLDGVQYDVAEFQYLARVSADPSVLVISAKKPYKTIEDLAQASDLKMSVTGVGEDDFYTWSVIFKAFGVENYNWVTGWEGTSQWLSATAAGEVDGGPLSGGSAEAPVKNGDVVAVMQVATERDPRFPDTPTALESLPADSPNRDIVEAITDALTADRLIATSPNLSSDKVAALREGLNQAMNNPELVEKANQASRPIAYMDGEELEKRMIEAISSVDILKPIFDEAAQKAQ